MPQGAAAQPTAAEAQPRPAAPQQAGHARDPGDRPAPRRRPAAAAADPATGALLDYLMGG